MTNTDDKWGGVGADVLLLLEHFYHTRIDRHGLSSRDDSSSPTFPRAQAILDGELFRRVQEELGLLQTVIVYGLPTDGPSPRYQHLETTLQLVVPWLAVKPGRPEDTTWQLAPLARADAMGKVFRKFREDPEHGVQEFAELLGTAGRGSGNRPGLSPLEQRLNYLLVDDEEMSFFSLVFTLLEARNASSTLDELESWITGSSRLLLRSILRQTDLDGPPGEPGKVRILESPWDDHYWDTATFDAAMAALGFQSPSGATDRFNRMLLWLSEPDGQVALMNPTLCRDGQKVTLADFVREVLISFRRGPEPKPADMPQKFACSLATALDSVTFDEIGVEHLAGSDVLRTSPGPVRFNLPGEYLLRRDESISRTFFATPLSTVNLVEEGTHATAFALGTLLKLDRRDSDLERRLGMLRVLLDAIADFGVSHRIAELAIRAELGRKILGKRPHKALNPAVIDPARPLATVADFTPLLAPVNPRLMRLYDLLDDRMGLVHHCLSQHRLRQASGKHNGQYWGNDPVRDGWRSDLSHCCEGGEACQPRSPYRFTFLVQKAKEFANQTRELGGALLAAFEKGDAEYLASLRASHEEVLLLRGLEVRKNQVREAMWARDALHKTKEADQESQRYYQMLIANGLNSNENGYEDQTAVALGLRTASNVVEAAGQLLVLVPDIWTGSTGVTAQLSVGTKLQGVFTAAARILNVFADNASTTASLDLTNGGFDRRLQDWCERFQNFGIQIEQMELQILGSERRLAQTQGELNNQQTQIEQSAEVMDFMSGKFTSHAEYLRLQKHTADLYFQMYELALSAARQAEQAFRFERGYVDRTFVRCKGWDSLHEGLLAGEGLQLSLAQMEKAYCDHNRREYELTKHISLRLQFPMEFLLLKLTGRCEIEVPEWMFDMDYPGHFMRRIKDVSLTIPGVSGPYNGVHCQLTLLRSATRVDPLLSLAPAHCCHKCKSGNAYEACPHDPRLVRQYAATEAIATSSGQNDSGLFEMNLHDERYLPFEGRGVVSKWRIEMPLQNNYFDMDTLSDFILHLNYTARDGGERLHHAAQEAAEKRLPGAGWCLFDVQHDFPDAWELFRSQPGQEDKRPRHLNLKFSRNLFPFLPGRRDVRLDKMALLFDSCQKPDCDCCVGECACGENKVRACWRVGFKNAGDECEETRVCCAASEEWTDLYYGVIDTKMSTLRRNGDRQEARFRFPAEVGEICQMFLLCRYEVAPRCSNNC